MLLNKQNDSKVPNSRSLALFRAPKTRAEGDILMQTSKHAEDEHGGSKASRAQSNIPNKPEPQGSKVSNYRVLRVSTLGIVAVVLGRYLLVGYFDP